MHLVLFDLFPLLLSMEAGGPSASGPPAVAAEMLEQVFPDFRVAGISDGDHTGVDLRRALEDAELDGFFDYIGTTAEFGPRITPRVIRRLARLLGFPLDQIVLITARADIADELQEAGLAVVHVEGPGGLEAIPEALEALITGYFSP